MGRNIAGVVIGYVVMFVVVMTTFTVAYVLGVILAIPALDAPPTDEPRTGDVSNADAMMKAQQPPAVSFLNPVLGALGVVIGGGLKKSPGASA